MKKYSKTTPIQTGAENSKMLDAQNLNNLGETPQSAFQSNPNIAGLPMHLRNGKPPVSENGLAMPSTEGMHKDTLLEMYKNNPALLTGSTVQPMTNAKQTLAAAKMNMGLGETPPQAGVQNNNLNEKHSPQTPTPQYQKPVMQNTQNTHQFVETRPINPIDKGTYATFSPPSTDLVVSPYNGVTLNNVKVYDLTAFDETLLVSPMIGQNINEMQDELLMSKIDLPFHSSQLLCSDRDAFILFMRSRLDHMLELKLEDPATKKTFIHKIDLTTLGLNPVIYQPDENSEYTFTFSQKINGEQKDRSLKFRLMRVYDEYIIGKQMQNDLRGQNSSTQNLKRNMYPIYKLQRLVTEVDGVRDSNTIYNEIISLPLMVSRSLHEYIETCTPSFDFKVEVTAPSGSIFRHVLSIGIDSLYIKPAF